MSRRFFCALWAPGAGGLQAGSATPRQPSTWAGERISPQIEFIMRAHKLVNAYRERIEAVQ
jgi:hypothetical protein